MKTPVFFLLLALLVPPAFAQSNDSLVVLFESLPGLRLALGENADLWRQNDRRDANGDGKRDLLLITEDAGGNPDAVLVLGEVHDGRPAAKQAGVQNHGWNDSLFYFKWADLVDLLGGREPTRFLGFYPFFGSDGGLADTDGKALVVRAEGTIAVLRIDWGSHKPGSGTTATRLAADQSTVADLDADGVAELIVRNPQTNTVQVWGRADTSPTSRERIEAALSRLFQNYPNPFQTRTTIAYEVERPGPVTLTVYDLLGRAVRTLVDEDQPIGAYRLEWDGRDAAGRPVAAGMYLYRLRVGDAVSSKQAVRVR